MSPPPSHLPQCESGREAPVKTGGPWGWGAPSCCRGAAGAGALPLQAGARASIQPLWPATIIQSGTKIQRFRMGREMNWGIGDFTSTCRSIVPFKKLLLPSHRCHPTAPIPWKLPENDYEKTPQTPCKTLTSCKWGDIYLLHPNPQHFFLILMLVPRFPSQRHNLLSLCISLGKPRHPKKISFIKTLVLILQFQIK